MHRNNSQCPQDQFTKNTVLCSRDGIVLSTIKHPSQPHLNIEIFRQIVTNPRLNPWAQERRELGARGPA